MTGPLTLAQWLAQLRRKGVQVRLHGGRVRVSGLRKLAPAERSALFESSEQVRQLLEKRAARRRKGQEQQPSMAAAQRERKVIGQVVLGSGRSRLLFEDECRPIPAHARVIGKVPYGWLIGGE